MSQIQALLKTQFYKISLFLVLIGYLTVLGELFFSGHTSGSQVIGFYSTILGVLLVAHGIIDIRMSKVLALLLLVVSIFGLVGAYKHYSTRETKIELAFVQQSNNENNSTTLVNGRIISPPLMAPLAISGLAMFAVITLLAAPKEDEGYGM